MRHRRRYMYGGQPDPTKKKFKRSFVEQYEIDNVNSFINSLDKEINYYNNILNENKNLDDFSKSQITKAIDRNTKELNKYNSIKQKKEADVTNQWSKKAFDTSHLDQLPRGTSPIEPNKMAYGGRMKRQWGGTIGTVVGGVGGAFLGNPMMGAKIGGMIGGGIDTQIQANQQAQEQARLNQRQFQDSITMQPNEIQLSPSNGFYGEQGGAMPMAVTNSPDVQEMSKTGGKFEGADHAQGGIPIDFDNDGSMESEVEGGEVFNNENLYSKRLKFSKDYQEMAKEFKFPVKSKSSYAQEAERLLKKLDKYEEMVESSDNATRNTGEIMIERVQNLLNSLFNDQEMKKNSL